MAAPRAIYLAKLVRPRNLGLWPSASHERAEIRPCNRVRADILPKFLQALDDAGMLAAFRATRGPPGAFFSVRKEWCAERQVWIQRLVLDRRPRNAQEQQLTPPEDTVPHGSAFIELQLDPQNVVRIWATDLPQYYYRMRVSPERAATNAFTEAIDGEEFRGLRAVRSLLEEEGAQPETRVGLIHFGLATMAMGDLNATIFAQEGHVALLREHGGLEPAELVTYRGTFPAGDVAEGVMIDDHAVVAQVPATRGWRKAAAARRATLLHESGRAAYRSIGVPDVDDKRREGQLTATIWGCEIQGRRGRAGAPRARRAALSALTVELCRVGATTVALLTQIVGLWVDVLLYRRAAFATLRNTYAMLARYKEDVRPIVRTIPGPVVSELLGLAALAPLLDTSLRAPVCPEVKVSDASPYGGASVQVSIGRAAAAELWRHRVRPGNVDDRINARGVRRSDDAVGELLEGCPAKPVLAFQFPAGRGPHINIGESRARRALWRHLAADPAEHGKRHLVAYDSAVTVGASVKGRSPSGCLMRELQITAAHILAIDCQEGALWCASESNLADSGSRQGPIPVPAPRRAWAAAFIEGDTSAFTARRAGHRGIAVPEADADADHRSARDSGLGVQSRANSKGDGPPKGATQRAGSAPR